MEIRIIGRTKTGKTIVATMIREMLESLGASVTVNDTDKPRHITPGSKPLLGQDVIVTVECIRKGG